MLSIIIPTRNDADALAQMLPGLVPHAVDGLISDVVLFDGGSTDETRRVGEIAGCAWHDANATSVAELLSATRGAWLLILEPGCRPVGDWTRAVDHHIASPTGAAGAARFRLARDPALPWWRPSPRINPARRPFARGFLISRAQAMALCRPEMSLTDLPQGLAVRTLPAALIPPR